MHADTIIVNTKLGLSDCSLFALAFLSILAKGEDPSAYTFKMGTHVHHCLTEGVFSDLISNKKNKEKNTKIITAVFTIAVFRMPTIEKMIHCDRCHDWYHIALCVTVSESVCKEKKALWYCEICLFLLR